MREQHLQNHKMSGIELKRQRGMSLKSQSITPQPVSDTEKSSPTVSEESPKLNWDNAALSLITFLSSRINPNVNLLKDYEGRHVVLEYQKMILTIL